MMFQIRHTCLIAAAAAAATFAGPTGAFAHAGLGDLMIYVDGGKLTTGYYDADGGTGLVTDAGPAFVYTTELEADWEGGGTPGIDEPGVATDGSVVADPDGQVYPFPANTALNISANLLPGLNVNAAYWTGAGAPNFVASPHTIEVEGGFSSLVFDGTSSLPGGSVSPWISDASGAAHDHLEFLLDESDAFATPGIYLFSLTFSATGVQSSDPVYFVAGYGLGEPAIDVAIESAEEWVEQNLVPEPASLTLGLVGAAMALIRHPRKR